MPFIAIISDDYLNSNCKFLLVKSRNAISFYNLPANEAGKQILEECITYRMLVLQVSISLRKQFF